jgi:hypothetical protein
VRSNGGLLFVWVVEAFHIVKARDVRVDGGGPFGLGAQVVKELTDSLVTIGSGAEWVDDLD